MQLNVDPGADLIHHVVAVHVKCHWTKLSLPTDIAAIITDHSMEIGQIQKMGIGEAMSLDSGVKILQQFLGPTPFTIVLIHRMCPRVQLNSTHAKEHLIASKLVHKRATR